MASQFQGFDIDRNMRESASPESDRNILNNIGGGSIADDMLTFYNNLRNTSTLTVDTGDISANGYIVKPFQQFVYTDGTEITVGSNTYYITDSDGRTTFRISSTPDSPTVVLAPPTGQYIRKDDVLFRNISSLSLDRPKTLEEISTSEIYTNSYLLTEEERFRLDTSLFLMLRASAVESYPVGANEFLDSIDNSISLYEQRREKSILKNKPFSASTDINFKGVITVVDSTNVNNTGLVANTNPGVFILNTRSGEYVRAFSSNDNAWTESGANLVVSSSDIIIGNLMFTGTSGISLLSKNAAVIAEDVTPSANLDFTHYIDVNINGEDYSLCLFLEP